MFVNAGKFRARGQGNNDYLCLKIKFKSSTKLSTINRKGNNIFNIFFVGKYHNESVQANSHTGTLGKSIIYGIQ